MLMSFYLGVVLLYWNKKNLMKFIFTKIQVFKIVIANIKVEWWFKKIQTIKRSGLLY